MDTPHVASGSIVVGIDGSSPANLALDWAAAQAAAEHRPLTLVHARGPLDPFLVEPAIVDLDLLVEAVSTHARTILGAAASRALAAHPDVVVHQLVSDVDPRETLLELAQQAAMVVVGSRGRGPIASLLLGSVSLAVSTHATCPVVVIRPEDPAFPHDFPHHGVLVGVEGTAASQPALEFAYRLASSRGWMLTVLQCFWDARLDGNDPADTFDTGDIIDVTPDDQSRHRLLTDSLDALKAKFPDVHVAVRLQRGFLDQRLIRLSPSMDATVVGSHHPNLLQRAVYGSIAPRVVDHAAGAVVIVPLVNTPASA